MSNIENLNAISHSGVSCGLGRRLVHAGAILPHHKFIFFDEDALKENPISVESHLLNNLILLIARDNIALDLLLNRLFMT